MIDLDLFHTKKLNILSKILIKSQSIFLFFLLAFTSFQRLPGYDKLNAKIDQISQYIYSSANVYVNALPGTEWLLFSYNNSKNPLEDQQRSERTLLFYFPGGTVDYLSYAPTAFKIVEQMRGRVFVCVPKVPIRAAIFSQFAPLFALNFFRDNNMNASSFFQQMGYSQLNVTSYFLGGHSLGGGLLFFSNDFFWLLKLIFFL